MTPLRRAQNDEEDDRERDYKVFFAGDIEYALLEHVTSICEELVLAFHHVEDWFYAVMFDVFKSLEDVHDGPDYGSYGFCTCYQGGQEAEEASCVILGVNQAANRVCIMYKTCYTRIAKRERIQKSYG